MMRSRILIGVIAGALGGGIGWFLQEMLVPYGRYIVLNADGVCEATPMPGSAAFVIMIAVYGLTGICLGSTNGVAEGNAKKILKGAIIGFFGCMILGRLFNEIGAYLFLSLGGVNRALTSVNPLDFVRHVVARVVWLTLLGLGVGLGASLGSLNKKKIRNGAIGGLLAGLLSGLVFDILAPLTAPARVLTNTSGCYDAGGPGRAITYIGIAALTGLFMALVEEWLKQAWVRVLAGRGEGKDFILYNTVSLLGRDERCDVPLFGDNAVSPQHAAIRADGKRHFLLAADTPAGTIVNGQPVEPGNDLLLRDGDMIQIGSIRMEFHEKSTAQRLTKPNDDLIRSQKSGQKGMVVPSHLCQFCGSPKDAAGNCNCTVGQAPMPSAGGYTSAPPPMGGNFQTFDPGYSPMPAPSPAGTMARGQLIGLDGYYAGQVFQLANPIATIGRESDNNIVLTADATISRKHAMVSNQNGVYVLTDNNSSNGTAVNGQKLYASNSVPLVPGDMVQFGTSKFRFE